MKKWKKPLFVLLLSTVGLLVVLVAGAVMYANFYVNDEDITVSEELFPEGDPKKIMAIFAHPDDEIMIAGTYHKLNKDKDVTSVLATFTRGEAGGTGGLVPKEKLGETRTKELEKSAGILNIDHLEVYDYPDSGLADADHEDIKKTIKKLIDQYKPTTVITYDDVVGLYGHPDHVVMSKLTREVVTEEMEKEDSSVKRLYFATLPQPMIDLALKLSPTFKERYPRDKGLPEPTIAFPMASEASARKHVLLAHETQWKTVASVQPYHDKVPSWIYYRIFDREYYHLVKSK
ncbi:PIG-L family deacetylase [Mesobacillus jeotgali]|uniref:PIG-L family deacetylase n=1 Tax=Mesobacillus jeotgali TaxID=129985 RepID=A0ABY9VUR9_9BACI|nr:PIG-L family deacetylase [Mesobacillus jeotgali]WNF24736.1 PIG-L family deacetylase [Mesobacillus jeotgali]